MLKNYNTNVYPDLRKKNSIRNDIQFSGINFNVCMVIFAVIFLFLYGIYFVVAQNPIY